MKKIIIAALIVATFIGGYFTGNISSQINEAEAMTSEGNCDDGIKLVRCNAIGNWSKARRIRIQIPPGNIYNVNQTSTDTVEILYTPE